MYYEFTNYTTYKYNTVYIFKSHLTILYVIYKNKVLLLSFKINVIDW